MTTMLPALVMLGWLMVMLLVVGILLVAFRRRPQRPGWVEAPVPGAPGGASGDLGTAYVGEWNAEVLGAGGLGVRGRTYGLFRLEGGVLSFLPDSAPAPTWSVPCDQVAARQRGFFELDGADVRLVGPMGDLRCNVSTEHINRMSRNTAKDLRERRYAEEFVHLLRAHGAGVAP